MCACASNIALSVSANPRHRLENRYGLSFVFLIGPSGGSPLTLPDEVRRQSATLAAHTHSECDYHIFTLSLTARSAHLNKTLAALALSFPILQIQNRRFTGASARLSCRFVCAHRLISSVFSSQFSKPAFRLIYSQFILEFYFDFH